MEIHLKIIGILLMALALVHAIFPRYFHWKTELRSLSLINRQMMEVHTFFIALTVLLMGVLCFTSAAELSSTALGRKISFGLFLFWAVRFVFQFFVYSSKLWKGKPFETTVHVVFSIFWLYVTVVFLLVFLGKG
jgi:hypothetical protein